VLTLVGCHDFITSSLWLLAVCYYNGRRSGRSGHVWTDGRQMVDTKKGGMYVILYFDPYLPPWKTRGIDAVFQTLSSLQPLDRHYKKWLWDPPSNTARYVSALCLPNIMHVTKSPTSRPFPSVSVHCKWSKTVGGEG